MSKKKEKTVKETLTTMQLTDRIHADHDAGFSYYAAKAIANHLEEREDASGEEMELDLPAIRGEYTEYSDARKACDDRGFAYDTEEDDDETEANALMTIEEETIVLELPGGGIVIVEE